MVYGQNSYYTTLTYLLLSRVNDSKNSQFVILAGQIAKGRNIILYQARNLHKKPLKLT